MMVNNKNKEVFFWQGQSGFHQTKDTIKLMHMLFDNKNVKK